MSYAKLLMIFRHQEPPKEMLWGPVDLSAKILRRATGRASLIVSTPYLVHWKRILYEFILMLHFVEELYAFELYNNNTFIFLSRFPLFLFRRYLLKYFHTSMCNSLTGDTAVSISTLKSFYIYIIFFFGKITNFTQIYHFSVFFYAEIAVLSAMGSMSKLA